MSRSVVIARGLPCMWESGGSWGKKSGSCQVIADRAGRPKPSIEGYAIPNGRHALIPVENGDYVIKTFRDRTCYVHFVYRIDAIDMDAKTADLSPVCAFSYGGWYYYESQGESISDLLSDAISASRRKTEMFRCREAVYVA